MIKGVIHARKLLMISLLLEELNINLCNHFTYKATLLFLATEKLGRKIKQFLKKISVCACPAIRKG